MGLMTDNFTLAHCNSIIRMRAIHYIDDEVCNSCSFQDKWKTFNTLSVEWCTGILGTHYVKVKSRVTVWSIATAAHLWRLRVKANF